MFIYISRQQRFQLRKLNGRRVRFQRIQVLPILLNGRHLLRLDGLVRGQGLQRLGWNLDEVQFRRTILGG